MILLQNEYRQQLMSLDIEINSLYAQLAPLKTHKEYEHFEKNLKEHLESFSKAILIKKEKKYWRDKNVFCEGRAYKWNQDKKFRNNKMSNKNKKGMIENVNGPNDYSSDTPSNSSSSVSSHTCRLFGEKRKGLSPRQN